MELLRAEAAAGLKPAAFMSREWENETCFG
jgi:hypothetical protein